ncbi:MAG TPA: tetratricopeptide repeat protein [Thermoanaerobaculia bacterium]
MSDPSAEARIRELRRRITQDVTSSLFIGLAEEYRAAGQLSEAIRTLEKGIQTYPHYVSAKVALARAYLEAGQTGDAAALFWKVLALDPGNLIAARSLADIHLSRGERIEAVKKYKLYRALSGDRGVGDIIERIERDLGPAPESPGEPRGRVLADLYFAQGHYAEALTLYQEMARSDPSDGEIALLVSEALARLGATGGSGAPQGSPSLAPDSSSTAPDGNPARRQARIQALKRWLSVIQEHSHRAASG